ncbi:MAG: hypothetical protein WA434_01340 [Candidatus Acidiferrales bacterium]
MRTTGASGGIRNGARRSIPQGAGTGAEGRTGQDEKEIDGLNCRRLAN